MGGGFFCCMGFLWGARRGFDFRIGNLWGGVDAGDSCDVLACSL